MSYYGTDYPGDVLDWMRAKELAAPEVDPKSPQLAPRNDLVSFVRLVCETQKLSVLTTHLAIHFLDRFLEAHHISPQQLHLAALSVILLSAKYEENDVNIPRIRDLNTFTRHSYSASMYKMMEMYMFRFFHYRLGSVTTAHFLEVFLLSGLSRNEIITAAARKNLKALNNKLWYSAQQFLDLTVIDKTYLKYHPSKLAAACILCARHELKMQPLWHDEIEQVTHYSQDCLYDLVDILIRDHQDESKDNFGSPDSGYRSYNSAPSSPLTDTNITT